MPLSDYIQTYCNEGPPDLLDWRVDIWESREQHVLLASRNSKQQPECFSTSADEAVTLDAGGASTSATGTWVASTASGDYGSGYFHDGNDRSVTKTYTFTPQLPADGRYSVQVWWPNDPSYETTIEAETGTLSGAAAENSIGGYSGSGYVKFYVNGSYAEYNVYRPLGGQHTLTIRAYAQPGWEDGFDLYVNGSPASLIYIDPSSEWMEASATITLPAGNSTIRFEAGAVEAPRLDKITISQSATFSSNTLVTVAHSGGSNSYRVDQAMNGGTWVTLGTYSMQAADDNPVTVSNDGANGFVAADAVRWQAESYADTGDCLDVTFHTECALTEAAVKHYRDMFAVWYVSPQFGTDWTVFQAGDVLPLMYADEPTDCELFDLQPEPTLTTSYYPQLNRELLELGHGAPSLLSQIGPNQMIFDCTYRLSSDQDIADLQDFWFRHYGPGLSFCLPSWQRDYALLNDAPAGSKSIEVVEHHDEVYEGMRLFVWTGEGYYVRAISGVVTPTVWELDRLLPVDLDAGCGICRVWRVTFSEDTLEIPHQTNSVADVNLKMVEEVRLPEQRGEQVQGETTDANQ